MIVGLMFGVGLGLGVTVWWFGARKEWAILRILLVQWTLTGLVAFLVGRFT